MEKYTETITLTRKSYDELVKKSNEKTELAAKEAVIKPFRDRVVCIKKVRVLTKSFEYITIRIASLAYRDTWSDIDFPYFKANSMYKNMTRNKNYTLEELGL